MTPPDDAQPHAQTPDPCNAATSDDANAFRRLLLEDGIIGQKATLTALTGGVSSDIYLIDDNGRQSVVKRALAKLRVQDDWIADVSRNRFELEYLRLVGSLVPQAVPRVLEARPEHGYFTMAYLGRGFDNWKTKLLSGVCTPQHAEQAGHVLGTIHRHTWADPAIEARFKTDQNFHQLRVDPYLLTTARRHPSLAGLIQAQAKRVESTHLALVHGDYSPKNILVGQDRLVVLDCEAAWFGDPSFDVAFLLNHLLLKALHLPNKHQHAMLQLAKTVWSAYANAIGKEHAPIVQHPLPTLLPMLMLARVDGKSPVEYLTAPQQDQVRRFVLPYLNQPAQSLAGLLEQWSNHLGAATP